MADGSGSGADLHPLQSPWTLWYYQAPANGSHSGGSGEWEQNLTAVGSFETVEGFWGYYRNAIWPSCIDFKSNYHLFKKGIQPMWEDPANEKGGKWVWAILSQLDKYWDNLVLGLIGEAIDPTGDEVCGAVISRRRAADRISVWNRTSDNKDLIMNLGKAIKKAVIDEVEHPPKFSMEWTVHMENNKTKPIRYTM
ncbi:EIF-4F 25 kDa subunit [Plasmodiophora brassicae]|uniref:EIF-4F 25 kDa subunit n=1 Tax=Plasmodiophora brassicae TaxID=37360 RepID=A0A0G4J7D0_PLABS|nr:hypothetical protein PBRA_002912 [Plasmodiophora brassicae]SPQ95399.1 unnamed protein product [Plasmodiophora brassicae]